MKIIAHVPARAGSQRLKNKNLLPLEGIPLLAHVVKAGINSRYISEVYINTDSPEMAQEASKYGAKVYMREPSLARDEVTQDTFNFDFISKMSPDILVLLNPVCPLIQSSDIDSVLEEFLNKKADAIITTTDIQSFALMENRALNFNPDKILPRTQDVPLVRLLNFAISAWRADAFMAHFKATGHACLLPNTLYFPLAKDKSIKINDIEDFNIARAILKMRAN